MIKTWLAHPLTRGIDLNDPMTTTLRRQVILQNGFLVNIYSEWYQLIKNSLPEISGGILELGSGGGFMDRFIPGVIKSEIIQLMMLFRYLVSGGVSLKQIMPDWTYPIWKELETVLTPANPLFSMFAFIHLERH